MTDTKWDGNLGGGQWVPLKVHQDKLKEQMANTIAWQMQAEKAADACTLALAERDALRAEVEKLRTENDELRTQADPPSGYCQRCGNLNAGGNHYAMHSEIDGLVAENEKLRAVERAARVCFRGHVRAGVDEVIAALNTYRASQTDKGGGSK